MKKLPEITMEEWNRVNIVNRNFYHEFLQQGHLSDRTIKQYRSCLRIFLKWVHDHCGNLPIHDLKPRHALQYQNMMMNRGLSYSAIKLRRSSVSSFCDYIELYYADEFPLFRNIYNKRIPNPAKHYVNEKQPITKDELELLIHELTLKEKWQMLAYLLFTYSSGCRREESRQLLKEVCEYEKVQDKPYYVTHPIRCKGRGKHGKVRKLPFDQMAMDSLQKWLDVRGKDDCKHMFVSKYHGIVGVLNPTTFNYWCSKTFSRIIGRKIHPHLIRTTRATHLSEEGKGIEAIQDFLSHESPDTTKIYIVKDTSETTDSIFA